MGFRWGFQWWKVGSGAVMLLIFGAISIAGLAGGYIIPWALVMALIGLCTIISGLIGEEGVW